MRYKKVNIILVVFLVPVLLLILSCGREKPDTVHKGFSAISRAQWIEDGRPLPASDSLFYLDWPAPLFRKEFKVPSSVRHAKLYITAAGYYNVTLNGKKVGENVLDPAWTDYSKRIYYTEYDVTSLVNKGGNCLGVVLGNGFYNPLPLRKWGHRNLREDLKKVGKPVFIARLHITYRNGWSEEIVSDQSWKYNFGPLTRNSVYLGVTYDARKEIRAWDKAGFDDSSWEAARPGFKPGGELQQSFFPPVRITREIQPVGISSPEEDVYLVDMGEVFTGTYKIRIRGNRGDTISFRFGERIYPDGNVNPMTTVIGQIKRRGVGGPGAPDIAWQSDQYILGDKSPVWFTPSFTYHTFRYMEIEGLSRKPGLAEVRGLSIHSNLEAPNSFSSSSDLLNLIQDATLRTFRANLVSVQSDCAAREKFGYGGDVNATSESFIYNFDMQAFYRKTIYDWVDAMKDSSFVDTAPFTGVEYCGISWESAFLITQYYLYLYYGDSLLIEELYDLDRQWMEKVAFIHPNWIIDRGLADHESLEPVPVELTGTCHYLQCARIMATFAGLMNDPEGIRHYEELAQRLKKLIKTEFWDVRSVGDINRQTLYAALLYHGVIPEEELAAAEDSLLSAFRNGPSGHFNTGIFGTKYILETLSEHGSPGLVFDVVNSTAYPGWGFMIDRGATTIWETWKESDNTYSNCHPMFGSVTEWYYRWLAGIRPDPAYPGFREFILAPSVPAGLDEVQCSYLSPFGKIISNWKKLDDGSVRYELAIPDGSRARISLYIKPHEKVAMIQKQKAKEDEQSEDIQSGRFALGAGKYIITVLSDSGKNYQDQ